MTLAKVTTKKICAPAHDQQQGGRQGRRDQRAHVRDAGVQRDHGAAVFREVAGEDAVAHRVLGAGADGGDAPGHDQHGVRAGQATHQRPQRDAEVAKPEELTAGEEGR